MLHAITSCGLTRSNYAISLLTKLSQLGNCDYFLLEKAEDKKSLREHKMLDKWVGVQPVRSALPREHGWSLWHREPRGLLCLSVSAPCLWGVNLSLGSPLCSSLLADFRMTYCPALILLPSLLPPYFKKYLLIFISFAHQSSSHS